MNKNEQVRKIVMEITNNQIADNDPPVTRKTLNRLVADGFSEEEAKEMISQVVWAEVFVIMKAAKPFNLDRYTAALNHLPEMPWNEN